MSPRIRKIPVVEVSPNESLRRRRNGTVTAYSATAGVRTLAPLPPGDGPALSQFTSEPVEQ